MARRKNGMPRSLPAETDWSSPENQKILENAWLPVPDAANRVEHPEEGSHATE